jgi:hypothetical protein
MSNIREYAKRTDVDGARDVPGRSSGRVVGSRLANEAARYREIPARRL